MLDLVEKDQCSVRNQFRSRNPDGNLLDQALCVQIPVKNRCETGVLDKVQADNMLIVFPCKFFNDKGFSNLSGPYFYKLIRYYSREKY